MKTAAREYLNSRTRLCAEPSPWGGKSEPSLLIHTGWKVKNYPVAGELFFLTSPFIELIRTNPTWGCGGLASEWATVLSGFSASGRRHAKIVDASGIEENPKPWTLFTHLPHVNGDFAF